MAWAMIATVIIAFRKISGKVNIIYGQVLKVRQLDTQGGNMRIVLFTAACLLVLPGCATNSGIVDLGGGNYVYAKEDAMACSGNAVKVEILKEASAFCAKQGKQLTVQSSDAKPCFYSSYAGAEVQFSCK
ncbi:MAG: hypothetical protein LBJ76_06870 [Candidatus Accumulibacter sp.]|jgi:hypothetical protein|nr:hypothetical protein [Accumulibacter sp.]